MIDYNTLKLNTTHLRGLRSVANKMREARGYRKELAVRIRMSDDFLTLNMHLSGEDDDLWYHEPVEAFLGNELAYARDSIIEMDVWCYDRFDELQGQVSVYGVVTGNQIHWMSTLPHLNDVLRFNVLHAAGRADK